MMQAAKTDAGGAPGAVLRTGRVQKKVEVPVVSWEKRQVEIPAVRGAGCTPRVLGAARASWVWPARPGCSPRVLGAVTRPGCGPRALVLVLMRPPLPVTCRPSGQGNAAGRHFQKYAAAAHGTHLGRAGTCWLLTPTRPLRWTETAVVDEFEQVSGAADVFRHLHLLLFRTVGEVGVLSKDICGSTQPRLTVALCLGGLATETEAQGQHSPVPRLCLHRPGTHAARTAWHARLRAVTGVVTLWAGATAPASLGRGAGVAGAAPDAPHRPAAQGALWPVAPGAQWRQGAPPVHAHARSSASEALTPVRTRSVSRWSGLARTR